MEVDNIGKNTDEVADEDPIELPPDTLAILNEFLRNKSAQESLETNHGSFEEDWVVYTYINHLRFIKCNKYIFCSNCLNSGTMKIQYVRYQKYV